MTATSPAENKRKMNGRTDELAERERLLERDAEWAAVASGGRDVDRILSYWADDAVVLPPGFAPVIGKAALRAYVENCLRIPGFKITWKSTDVKFSPDLNLAYMLGENTVTMNGPDGEPVMMKGRGVTIWCRGSDGIWRCAVDIWNDAPRTEVPV
jgi:ketosteroid isomerase-like protein